MSPSKARFCRCNKLLTTATKKRLELNDSSGIPSCKSFMAESMRARVSINCPLEKKISGITIRNHIQAAQKLRLGDSDAEAIYQYFLKKQKENVNFIHAKSFSEEGHMKHVFSVDLRSRSAYKYFGDAISFILPNSLITTICHDAPSSMSTIMGSRSYLDVHSFLMR
ncbi:hypothetical protein Syun_014434 [Stephania yunnanensis]|uniref:Uncharacterized protein n=1 Tax=Stephania yunnanensis TaxID=152371 RepID=A0AAP0JJJ9_9MAGN